MTRAGDISFITESAFTQLLDELGKRGSVYMPRVIEGFGKQETYSYRSRITGQEYRYFGFRPSQPMKTFLFEGRIKVAEYPASENRIAPSSAPVTVVGAASCDIESIHSLDVVFLQETFTDVFYRERRNNTFIISADCTSPRETCLCTAAGIQPYPTGGFDLNLTKVEGGYLLDAGSEKGALLVEENASLVSSPSDKALDEREKSRKETVRKIEEMNAGYRLSTTRHDLLAGMRTSTHWYEQVKTCVDCAACLFSCPTCHCFLLSDQKGESGTNMRFKAWDSCSYAGYSRMAGGSSPRLGLMERFRHRYLHKFEYYPFNFGFEACTGCGRCIEGCMGKIDMRRVFMALDKERKSVEQP